MRPLTWSETSERTRERERCRETVEWGVVNLIKRTFTPCQCRHQNSFLVPFIFIIFTNPSYRVLYILPTVYTWNLIQQLHLPLSQHNSINDMKLWACRCDGVGIRKKGTRSWWKKASYTINNAMSAVYTFSSFDPHCFFFRSRGCFAIMTSP